MESELVTIKGDALQKLGLLFDDADIPYEEELIRNPYSVKTWLRYIEHREGSNPEGIYFLYERALKELPGSYKLWSSYLKFRTDKVKLLPVNRPEYRELNRVYERALVFMGKMPRIWLSYLGVLIHEGLVTKTRRTFDRALVALPVTQHKRIWNVYVPFVRECCVPETARRVMRRFLQIKWECAEEVVEFLVGAGFFDEGARLLADVINDPKFVSRRGRTKFELWEELCGLMVKHVGVDSVDVEGIIRQGIEQYADQAGVLWNCLVEFFVRNGQFDKARDVYEEAMLGVRTVRDFSQIFEGYAHFEESMASAAIERLGTDLFDLGDVEYCTARYEYLIERRAILLNSVKIRQNPHNVDNWQQRALLTGESGGDVVAVYNEALRTIETEMAVGKPHTLWIAFAHYYEGAGQLEEAETVFGRAVEADFEFADDLAAVWGEWVEMEIRNQNVARAFELLRRVTTGGNVSYFDKSLSVQARVHKSLKLWALYADLEESFGSFEGCKGVYDAILDMRIANPQIIANYALFLEEHHYFEKAFQVYERGIGMFRWPVVVDLWNSYLTKFVDRFGKEKLERARDLFEQCLQDCPPKYCDHFYSLYAEMEEKYGMSRHAMAVYERATDCVALETRIKMFKHYIARASEWYGVTSVRTIYEKAIQTLPDPDAREMCLAFVRLEQKLGEIDRARVILSHCSQFCDPATDDTFWSLWSQFELQHGNEDTIREMLRVKRSVQAFYNTSVGNEEGLKPEETA